MCGVCELLDASSSSCEDEVGKVGFVWEVRCERFGPTQMRRQPRSFLLGSNRPGSNAILLIGSFQCEITARRLCRLSSKGKALKSAVAVVAS